MVDSINCSTEHTDVIIMIFVNIAIPEELGKSVPLSLTETLKDQTI